MSLPRKISCSGCHLWYLLTFVTLLVRASLFTMGAGEDNQRDFIHQWEEAVNGVWLRPETRESHQKEIGTGNRITFQEGKGN